MTLPYRSTDPAEPTAQDRDRMARQKYDNLRAAREHIDAAIIATDEAIKALEQAHRLVRGEGFERIARTIKVLALHLEMHDFEQVIDLLEDEAPR